MTSVLQVLEDAQAVGYAAASMFVTRALDAIAARGRFSVALSGGTTPLRFYAALASRVKTKAPGASALAWDQVHVFWGDERTVPPDHPDSNFCAAHGLLLAHLGIPDANIHRMQGELDPGEAAANYEEVLRRQFGLGPGAWPVFDLIFLGLGLDLHTASLFPGSAALDERERLVVATWVSSMSAHRITLTPPAIRHARAVLFLVTGGEKAAALREVLETEPDPRRRPAQLAQQMDGDLIWLVDRAAASGLSEATLRELGR